MKNPVRRIMKLAALTIVSWTLLFSIPVYAQPSIGTAQITKLARQFNISPDILSKFTSMSLEDMKGGLDIAKNLSGMGGLSMDDAVSQVMGALAGGKDLGSVASEFGVDMPAEGSGLLDGASKSLKKKLN
jgi:hypothetical protein